MKPLLGVFPLLLGLAVIAPAQTVVQGEPFGYVKLNITAGTGNSKRLTLLSIPLLEEANITGRATGRITGVTSNTITASGAGWANGQLSALAAPHLLEITSGAAKGRMLLLSTTVSNTADTVTIHPDEAIRVGDLREMGISTGAQNGDTYRIRPVDTLSSFFGTPETTLIRGGATPSSADTITIVINGRPENYFYNTAANPPRWTRVVIGSPDASHTPIPPYAGLQYSRLANTPLEFIVTGKVPDGERRVAVKNSGPTVMSSFWPSSQTLNGLGLHSMTNWQTGTNSSSADTVVITSAGSANTFFYDGQSWRRVALGNPLANTNAVPVGSSVLINKRGSAGGYSTYLHAAPYSLQ